MTDSHRANSAPSSLRPWSERSRHSSWTSDLRASRSGSRYHPTLGYRPNDRPGRAFRSPPIRPGRGSLDHRLQRALALDAGLFFVPALAAQRLFALLQAQRHLTEGLSSANRQLESANLSFASALVATLDARDRYTAGHSAAVAIYSETLLSVWVCQPQISKRRTWRGLFMTSERLGFRSGSWRRKGLDPRGAPHHAGPLRDR